ncbi:hypothetical protein CAXC1_120041 [Candidatus Xenohaliotis californiensis]|uniref:Uncharacterized protein n=1 Tax=Candidatus Xenohaliotis californiensis TaxID=84677 RepID=A0ABP0ERM7_9RICK|nr:hypothetical protein CAXC1_120041 [Candidatus Xenohaliotis californiensis]
MLVKVNNCFNDIIPKTTVVIVMVVANSIYIIIPIMDTTTVNSVAKVIIVASISPTIDFIVSEIKQTFIKNIFNFLYITNIFHRIQYFFIIFIKQSLLLLVFVLCSYHLMAHFAHCWS